MIAAVNGRFVEQTPDEYTKSPWYDHYNMDRIQADKAWDISSGNTVCVVVERSVAIMRHRYIRKLSVIMALAVSLSFITGFADKYVKAETKYKEAPGISLPDVEHNRQIEKTGECGEGLSYVLEDDGTLTITGTGQIADEAFRDVPAIRNVVINEGVSGIGAMAFLDTWNIVTISFPQSMRIIGDSAFSVCRSLGNVSIPEGVTSVGEGSFSCCFAMNKLSIPSTLTDIGDNAFYGCVSLDKIVVSDNNPAYDSREECNALIDSRSNELLVGCRSTVIPEGIAAIGEYAFASIEGFTDIVIPDSIKTIGKSAFFSCIDLKNIHIPSTVESIGENAFFEHNRDLAIHTKKDSYVWSYAVDNKIAVIDTGSTDSSMDDKSAGSNSKEPDKAADIKQTSEISNNTTVQSAAMQGVVKKQTLSIGKVKTYRAKKLRKKSVSFKMKVSSSGNGNITFKIKNGEAKYITVNKSGKVTLKKGIKKGVYNIHITAHATPEYKEAKKVIKVRVK